MYLLFASTLFVSAALLFCMQPMVAKMILPLLGGTPSVWNTCMVFFQATLLAGYLYAHGTTTWFGVRRQAVLHIVILLLPLVVLPVAISTNAIAMLPTESNPIAWVLLVLTLSVGLPFFVVSTSAPLLQKWFAGTGHPAGRDPYFLYSASNLGSMLALLSYPLLLEPSFGLERQSWLWTAGYGVLVLLIMICAYCVWRGAGAKNPKATIPHPEPTAQSAESEWTDAVMPASPSVLDARPLTWGRRLRWVALAFVPSSLMLGVTLYITTDIAAIPLLWVMPLALYLFSFILVFASRPPLPHQWLVLALPLAVILALALFLLAGANPRWQLIPVHLLAFFVIAMFCHGELAQDRPPPRHLTEFYIWLSIGGVLGGLFNTLSAPLLFSQVGVAEYPLMLILATLLLPRRAPAPRWQYGLDAGVPMLMGLLTVGIFVVWKPTALIGVPVLGVLISSCYLAASSPLRLALCLAAIGLPIAILDLEGKTVHWERNFFGLVRITDDTDNQLRRLVHGGTMHGVQSLDATKRELPLSYFHRSGPIGEVFTTFQKRPERQNRHVAVTGLGVGSLAAYALPGQDWTYYEIDPAMKRVAEDPRYFTYLADARQRGATIDIVLGDARLRLREAPDQYYDLMVLDAFSSDSVPVHLITLQALQLYLEKLAPDGILAFNISNRYLDLKPVLANLAAHERLLCHSRGELEVTAEERKMGKTPSQWVIMARQEADLGDLPRNPRWQPLTGDPHAPLWTDDFSNVLGVFRWQ
ncbi:MAG: spermidine synthase [Gemmataceae bacterium]